QVVTLIEALPQYRAWFMETALPWVEQRTGIEITTWLDPQRLFELARNHWTQAGGVATALFGYLSSSGFAFLAWIANLVLLPILTFYFLRDWDLLVERVAVMVPRDHVATVARLAKESDEVLGAFLRGQFIVMLALGAIYALGLTLVGLKLGLLIGIIAGLISFVPCLGAATGIVLAVLAALVQAQGFDLKLLALVGVVFTVGQLIESYILTPRIVGDRIGLHPVAVIFAIMAGGQLFGFVGMLIALPVAAVGNVLLRFARERYTQSRLYAGDGPRIVLGEPRPARAPRGAGCAPAAPRGARAARRGPPARRRPGPRGTRPARATAAPDPDAGADTVPAAAAGAALSPRPAAGDLRRRPRAAAAAAAVRRRRGGAHAAAGRAGGQRQDPSRPRRLRRGRGRGPARRLPAAGDHAGPAARSRGGNARLRPGG